MSTKADVSEAIADLESYVRGSSDLMLKRLMSRLRAEWDTYRKTHRFTENTAEWLHEKKKRYGKVHSYSDYLALQILTQLIIEAEKEHPLY